MQEVQDRDADNKEKDVSRLHGYQPSPTWPDSTKNKQRPYLSLIREGRPA